MNSLNDLQDIQTLYRGWVNNRVMALVMAIQVNRNWSAHSLMKSEFFLEEIEHHFIDYNAEPGVWNAFRYLRHYLRSPAETRACRRQRALEMVGLIYEALGFEGLRIASREKNVTAKNSQNPQDIQQSVAAVAV